jgi:hypothetical protein
MIFDPFRAGFLGDHGRAQALSGSAQVALELGHLLLRGATAFDGRRYLEIGVRANDMNHAKRARACRISTLCDRRTYKKVEIFQ